MKVKKRLQNPITSIYGDRKPYKTYMESCAVHIGMMKIFSFSSHHQQSYCMHFRLINSFVPLYSFIKLTNIKVYKQNK